MGQVQNGHLYISYRSNSQKNTKQRSERSLQTTSLCYSIAKSTFKTPLTSSKVEKTKPENFAFVHILSSSSSFFFSIKHYSKTIRFVKIWNIPNGWPFAVDYSYRFSASCKLQLASYMYGLNTIPNTLRVLLHTLLSFSFNNCVGMACMFRTHRDNWTLALQAAPSLLGTNCV